MQKKLLFKMVLIVSGAVISCTVLAKHVLPTFVGSWYKNAHYLSSDSCLQASFKYVEKVEGDAKAAANKMLANVPHYSDCTWDAPKFIDQEPEIVPIDFPGTEDDWEKIAQDPSLQHSEYWGRYCINKQGYIEHLATVYVHPIYTCPAGSRYSFNFSRDEYGCSTTPGTCDADVVARELDFPLISHAGHVGLTELSDDIIEVAKPAANNAVVHNTTLSKFKAASEYWGEKYGVSGKPNLTDLEAVNIVVTAAEQDCDNLEYTFGWNYAPCDANDTQPKFRCDSFVYYSYLAGAGVKIGEWGITTIPRTLFERLLNYRFTDDEASYMLGNNITGYSNSSGQYIQSLFASPVLNLLQTDEATKNYVLAKEISRRSKLELLWKLSQQYQQTKEKFNYLLNCLGYLKPIELTDRIIAAAKTTKSKTILREYINLLVEAASARDNPQLKAMTVRELPKIREFFRVKIFSATDIEFLRNTILSYGYMAAPNQYYDDLYKVLDRSDIDTNKLRAELLWSEGFYYNSLKAAFASQNMQQKWLTQLISAMQSNSSPITTKFILRIKSGANLRLYASLHQDARIVANEVFNTALYRLFAGEHNYRQINVGIKPLLIRYLAQQKPLLNLNQNTVLKNLLVLHRYYDWLNVYAAVHSSSIDEQREFMAYYIANIKDIYNQLGLIVVADDNVLAKIPLQIITLLNNSFKARPRGGRSRVEKLVMKLGRQKIRQILVSRGGPNA